MLGKTLALSIPLFFANSVVSNAESENLIFLDSFKKFDASKWDVAEYDFTHPHFDTDWRKANVVFGSDEYASQPGMLIRVHANTIKTISGNSFVGGSIRRKVRSRYGRYESLIKPAKGDGLVTGFFTYTGPAYGTQHDEIDIEFLGKNTKQIHIAWFKDGKLTNKFIDLPFDAADKARNYAFEWLPNRINWYVEDTLLYSVSSSTTKIPNTPSLLFANVWAADPSINIWSGYTQKHQSGMAWFGNVKFTPLKQLTHAEMQTVPMRISTTATASHQSNE